eukprot:SAG22_NODE_7040_length_783_cov_0.871345_1_plen_139_part_01
MPPCIGISLVVLLMLPAAASLVGHSPPEFGHGTAWPANHLWPADTRAALRLPGPPAAGRTAAVATVPWFRRDLSPGPAGSAPPQELIKITDFGLSKDSHQHSNPHTKVGTISYMAPEVTEANNSEPYDGPAADVWSLGC